MAYCKTGMAPVCSTTEVIKSLDILDIEFIGINTILAANNKGDDQTVQICWLICEFVFHI